MYVIFFFFNDTATTEIYTLSLHDALPILLERANHLRTGGAAVLLWPNGIRALRALGLADGLDAIATPVPPDRKSTRLNSSHANISYAVFCLKKKNTSLNITLRITAPYFTY